MAHLSPPLATLVAACQGIVTARQLLADGWSRTAIRYQVESGALMGVHDGVYRIATSPDTFEARCVAACAADPSVVVTGPAAARLWDFRHVFRPEVPIVLVEHDRSPIAKGVVLRRTNVLDRSDWVERDDGVRVASPVRAWIDCARDLDDERFERLTEHVLDQFASVPTIWSMARRMSARGRPGMARVKRVLSQREPWQKPAGSGLELKVLKALEARGVTGLVRQHPIRLRNGVVVHPDGALLPACIRWASRSITSSGTAVDSKRRTTRAATVSSDGSTGRSTASPTRRSANDSPHRSTSWSSWSPSTVRPSRRLTRRTLRMREQPAGLSRKLFTHSTGVGQLK
ncbi:MAG: type IV toxin-antitoxin system AbiEi family antitoxin domain-containing protein [Ilumatobacteraceae bacterium]